MDTWEAIRSVLEFELVRAGAYSLTVGRLAAVVCVLALTLVTSSFLQRASQRALTQRGVRDEGTVGLVAHVLHYITLAAGVFFALKMAGIDLGGLFAAGAVFAVGIGFAMQNMAQNFVAGVGLLAERTIKPGAVLEVEGRTVKVAQMGVRATIVRSVDGEDLIVPNSVLMQSTVKNFTLRDSHLRIRCRVGVAYGSDMRLVGDTLREVGQSLSDEPELAPQVLLLEFGDSSVIWEVATWTRDPWNARVRRSELNQAIWWALKQSEITIAFPQLDLHLDSPLMSAPTQPQSRATPLDTTAKA